MSEANPTSLLRSIGAVLTGVVAVIVLSLGTDIALHATGIYPPWFRPMADSLWVLALAYRIVYGIAGSYITARIVRDRLMMHAMIVGVIGFVLTIVGVAANWNKGPEYGPRWFAIALILTTLPCAWIGGKLRLAQLQEN
ncbi:MAG TPA: hypothetical protein VNG71_22430 [Pyrinomonadaceae bacterium]|nr:hypothetical protein [Pyrinomonadaceae bacterium]